MFKALLLLLSVFGVSTVHTQPVAALTASRLSGPAPLAVSFNALGTTYSYSSNIWRDLGFHFTFDDPGSGVWAHTGKSKNSQIGGPVASHVFETQGTYTVQVRVQDATGEYGDASIEITVTDPDSVYAGSNTVCISMTTNMAGCPVNAQQLALTLSWPFFESNKRYLLRAGEDYTAFGTLDFAYKQDWQLGKFGSGADPVVTTVNIAPGQHYGGAPGWTERATVYDIAATGSFGIGGSSRDVTILRGSTAEMLFVGALAADSYNHLDSSDARRADYHWPTGLHLVEIITESGSYEGPSYSVYGAMIDSSIIGITGVNPGDHNVRLFVFRRIFLGHNSLSGAAVHFIKLQGNGLSDYLSEYLDDGIDIASGDAVIADNLLGNGTEFNNWSVGAGPEENDSAQRIENIIFESNYFHRGWNDEWTDRSNIEAMGRNIIGRGNTDEDGEHNEKTNGGSYPNLPEEFKGPYYWYDGQIIPDAPSAVIVEASDINADGVVDAVDLILMQKHLLGVDSLSIEQIARGDLHPPGTPNGDLNASDLLLLLQKIAN